MFTYIRMFEFRAKIPLVKNLKIQVMDYDYPDTDDLIGETEIDLEQRLLSKYHATCGLPKTYFKYVALIMYYSKHPLIRAYFFQVWQNRFLYIGVLCSTANDPQPLMIPRPQMIPKMDCK